jgi:hypothetical protein
MSFIFNRVFERPQRCTSFFQFISITGCVPKIVLAKTAFFIIGTIRLIQRCIFRTFIDRFYSGAWNTRLLVGEICWRIYAACFKDWSLQLPFRSLAKLCYKRQMNMCILSSYAASKTRRFFAKIRILQRRRRFRLGSEKSVNIRG